MKIFLETPGLQKFTYHSPFWKKLLNISLPKQESKPRKGKKWSRGKRRELKVISRWDDKGRSWVNGCAPGSRDNKPGWCSVTKRQPCWELSSLRYLLPCTAFLAEEWTPSEPDSYYHLYSAHLDQMLVNWTHAFPSMLQLGSRGYIEYMPYPVYLSL